MMEFPSAVSELSIPRHWNCGIVEILKSQFGTGECFLKCRYSTVVGKLNRISLIFTELTISILYGQLFVENKLVNVQQMCKLSFCDFLELNTVECNVVYTF